MSADLGTAADKENEKEGEEDEIISKKRQKDLAVPTIWQRITGSCTAIQDLTEEYFTDVLMLFKNYYIPSENLYKNTEHQSDDVSIEEVLLRAQFCMQNGNSLIAINEVTKEIQGFLLLQAIKKLEFARSFSRPQLFKGQKIIECTKLREDVNKTVDLYVHFQRDEFLRYYALCVLPGHRQKGLGFELMKSAVDLAKSKNIHILMGIFTNHKLCYLAEKLGLEVLSEVCYHKLEEIHIQEFEEYTCPSNYLITLMAGRTPAPRLPPEKPIDNIGTGKKTTAKSRK